MSQMVQAAKQVTHHEIVVPGSKSVTHRALLMAALANGVSKLSGIHLSQSVHSLMAGLQQLGVGIQLDEANRTCTVTGVDGQFPQNQTTLWCEESKTVARFLICACAAAPGVYYIDGGQSLRGLSVTNLLAILRRKGAQSSPNDIMQMPFTLIGADSLEGGELILDKSMTTQLMSALLMIAPLARSACHFTVVDLMHQPYVDMTCTMMAEFGVLVRRVHHCQWMVPVPQRYQAVNYFVEPDLSLAIYFFMAAALTSTEILLPGITRGSSKQADIAFLTVLEQMGCQVTDMPQGILLKGPLELQGIEKNATDLQGFGHLVAALAVFATTPTLLTHYPENKTKKNKLLEQMINQLSALGARCERGDDWIKIYPSTLLGKLVVEDHMPVAMGLKILELKIPHLVSMNDDLLQQAHPHFFTLLTKFIEMISY